MGHHILVFRSIDIEQSLWTDIISHLDLFNRLNKDGDESVSQYICDEITFYRCLKRFICIKRSKYSFLTMTVAWQQNRSRKKKQQTPSPPLPLPPSLLPKWRQKIRELERKRWSQTHCILKRWKFTDIKKITSYTQKILWIWNGICKFLIYLIRGRALFVFYMSSFACVENSSDVNKPLSSL